MRSRLLAMLMLPATAQSSAAGQETLIGVVGQDFVVLGADSSSSSSLALTSTKLDKIVLLSDPFPAGGRGDAGGDSTMSRSTASNNGGEASSSWEQQTIAAAAVGNAADADRLLGVLAAHCAVREYEAGIGCDVDTVYDGSSQPPLVSFPAGLDVDAVAHLARGEIAASLRSGRGQLTVCLLVAGMVRADTRLCDSTLEEQGGNENDRTSIDGTFAGRIRRQVDIAAASSTDIGNTPALTKVSRARADESLIHRSHPLIPRLFWLDEYGSIQRIEYGCHGIASNFALSILDRGYRPDMTREEAVALVRDCFDQLRTRFVINSPNHPRIKCVDCNGCHFVQ